MIKISIVITVFNGAKYLPELLTDLSQLSNSEMQIIVVDDGSTDQSFAVASEFKKLFPHYSLERLSENNGVGNARNIGIKLSVGKYIYFLDCDDSVIGSFLVGSELDFSTAADLIFAPVIRQISNLSNEFYLSVLNQAINMDRQDLLAASMRYRTSSMECWGLFIRREFLESNEIYFQPIRISEDFVFMTEVYTKLKSFSLVNSPVYIHTHHSGSLGKSFSNHEIHSWFAGFLHLVTLAGDNCARSIEGEFIEGQMIWCFAYFLIAFVLSDTEVQRSFLEQVSAGDDNSILYQLAVDSDDVCLAEDLPLEQLIDKSQVALKKIAGEVSPTNTYLYCYDRLSMGVCEMMEALGINIDGIIDDNAESIVPTEKLAVKLMSPSALNHKLLQHATIIVCHDNINVYATVKNRFLNEQKRGLRIVNVTTRDLVGDLAYSKFFKSDCV